MSEVSGTTQAEVQEVPQNQEPLDVQAVDSVESKADDNIYGDEITEEMIGAMFDGTYADADAESKPEAQGEQPQEEQPQAEEKTEEQPEPEQAEDDGDNTYELDIDGEKVELNGDQLHAAVKVAKVFEQHKDELKQAMQISQAIKSDPQLQGILAAYQKGEVPQMYAQQAQQAVNVPNFDQMPQEQQQAVTQLLGIIQPHLEGAITAKAMQMMQEWAQPFVNDVNNFAAGIERERAFNKYTSDPMHGDFTAELNQGIANYIADGLLTIEQAAQVQQKLQSDPKEYGRWFKEFKKSKQAQPTTQKVTNKVAPKVEGTQAAQGESKAAKARAGLNTYFQSGGNDLSGFDALFGD